MILTKDRKITLIFLLSVLFLSNLTANTYAQFTLPKPSDGDSRNLFERTRDFFVEQVEGLQDITLNTDDFVEASTEIFKNIQDQLASTFPEALEFLDGFIEKIKQLIGDMT